ncbi:hypothetical protein D3C75_1060430 [compost metagenome]
MTDNMVNRSTNRVLKSRASRSATIADTGRNSMLYIFNVVTANGIKFKCTYTCLNIGLDHL